MRARHFVLSASLVLGFVASAYAVLLWQNLLPDPWRPAQDCPPPPRPAASEMCAHAPEPKAKPDTKTPEASSVAPTKAERVPEQTVVPVHRYALCEMAHGQPVLSLLRLQKTEAQLVALHCGASVEIIALDSTDGASVTPRRIAHLRAQPPTPELHAGPGPVLAFDLSGDERIDLVVPFLWSDATFAPRGGALYEFVREPSLGLGAPLLLGSVAAGALASGRFDVAKGEDLALLHFEDARVERPSELIVVRGGPAPVKVSAAHAAIGGHDLCAVDLDLDGRDELIVLGKAPRAEIVYLGDDGQVRERKALEMGDAREVSATDVDGDGHADAVLVGDDVRVVIAAKDNPLAVQALGLGAGLTHVRGFDINTDGKLDFVAQSTESAVALVQTTQSHFERRLLVDFAGTSIVPIELAALHLGAEAHVALLVLTRSRAQPSHFELSLLPIVSGENALAWDPEPTALSDAPLSLTLTAP